MQDFIPLDRPEAGGKEKGERKRGDREEVCFCRRRTAQVMVQMWSIAIPVGFGGVQMVAQLRGLPLEGLTPADRVRVRNGSIY